MHSWVPPKCWGVILGLPWTSIPSRERGEGGGGGKWKYSLFPHATETGDMPHPDGPLGSNVNFLHKIFAFNLWTLLLLVNENAFLNVCIPGVEDSTKPRLGWD